MVGGGCVAVRAGDWNNHAAAVTMIGGCMYFVFVCVYSGCGLRGSKSSGLWSRWFGACISSTLF